MLESALQFCHSFDETHHKQQWHEGGVDGDEIAHRDHYGRSDDELLVGKAKLHAEKHRKINRHTCKIGIEQHHQVFNHKIGGTLYVLKRTKIHAARKLKAKHAEHIYPRLNKFRNPVAKHRHGKTHAGWRGRR